MRLALRYTALALALSLAGCTEDSTSDTGLSGTDAQFAQMRAPCIAQAARLTGIPETQIVVSSQLQTGGGPLLVLDARGTSYSCRLEADGSVTVFSEFAN